MAAGEWDGWEGRSALDEVRRLRKEVLALTERVAKLEREAADRASPPLRDD